MFVSTEVLVLLALGVLLLGFALYKQFASEARLKAELRSRDVPLYPYVLVDDGLPEAPPHEHVWAEQPAAFKKGFGLYPCTVPGCKAEPKYTATRRR